MCLGHIKGNRLWGLNLALSAVNLGETAKDTMFRFDLARIYATAALQIKASLPEGFQFVAVSVFNYKIKKFPLMDALSDNSVSIYCFNLFNYRKKNFFKQFQRYFLSRARYICKKSGDQVPANIQWLCHPEGHRFFVDSVKFEGTEDSIFSSRGTEGKK